VSDLKDERTKGW